MQYINIKSSKLIDPKSIQSDQTTTPFSGAMGDSKTLVLTYQANVLLDNFILYFNPALFTNSTYPFTDIKPSAYYLAEPKTTDVVGTLYDMATSGLTAYNNLECKYKILSGRKEIEIHLTHYFTFDVNDYVANGGITDQGNRLVNKLVNSSDTGNVGSVYDTQKSYGCYLYYEYLEPTYPVVSTTTNVEVTSDTVEVLLEDAPSVPANDYKIYLNDNTTPTNTGLALSVNSSQRLFFTGTSQPVYSGLYSSVRIVSDSDNIDVYFNIDSAGVELSSSSRDTLLPINLTYYNEGVMTSPTWAVTRSGNPVTAFSDTDDTNIIFRSTYASGTVASAKIWLIKVTNVETNINFKDAYDLVEVSAGAIVAEASNVYRTDFTIQASTLESDSDYRVLVLFYDTANNIENSFLSAIYKADSSPQVDTDTNYELTTITSKIDHYALSFVNEYITNVAIFDRYKAQIEIDKTSVTDFDSNIIGISAKLDTIEGTFTKTSGGYNLSDSNIVEVVQDDASTLVLGFYFRVREDWKLTTKDLLWTVNSSTEPTKILFTQRFLISEFETEKVTPEIEYIRIQDPDTHTQLTSFQGYNKPTFEVESKIKSGSAATLHLAIIDKLGNIREHETFASSFLTQRTDSEMSNVDTNFTGEIARYEVDINQVGADDRVAVIAKDNNLVQAFWSAYVCETEPIIIDLPEPTPPDTVTPVYCGTSTRSGGVGIFDQKYTSGHTGYFIIRFDAKNQTDKLEILLNGTIVATSGEHPDGNYGDPTLGFDPNSGIDVNLNDISVLPFDAANQRRRIANAQGAGTDPEGSDATVWFVGGAKSPPTRSQELFLESGIKYPVSFGVIQLIWTQVSIGDEIIVRVSGKTGTRWEYDVICRT